MKSHAAFLLVAMTTSLALGQAPAKPNPKASRTEIRSTANQVAAGIEAADAALSPAELAVAEQVYVGRLPCELGAFVTITPDAKAPGFFDVQIKNARFRMFPVESRTGAVRLEDAKSEALWLQLSNKSMLINRKLGQRMADECMSPAQTAVAEALKKNPAPSLLEPLPAPAASAPAQAQAPAQALVPAQAPASAQPPASAQTPASGQAGTN